MTLKYNIFSYLIGEGFRNVFKNKKSTAASLMIMCATMIIFGIFFIIGENINYFIAEIESAQGIQVYINNDANEDEIKEIVIPIVSALYGGILTLIGVAWTIKQNNDDSKNEKRLSVKPLVYPLSRLSEYDYKNSINIEFVKVDRSEDKHIIGVFQNSDNGILIIENAIVKGVEYKLFNKAVIAKNKAANVFVYTDDTEIETMYIVGKDVLGNKIKYKLILNTQKQDIESIIEEE